MPGKHLWIPVPNGQEGDPSWPRVGSWASWSNEPRLMSQGTNRSDSEVKAIDSRRTLIWSDNPEVSTSPEL